MFVNNSVQSEKRKAFGFYSSCHFIRKKCKLNLLEKCRKANFMRLVSDMNNSLRLGMYMSVYVANHALETMPEQSQTESSSTIVPHGSFMSSHRCQTVVVHPCAPTLARTSLHHRRYNTICSFHLKAYYFLSIKQQNNA